MHDLLQQRIVDELPGVRGFLRKLSGRAAEDLVQDVAERALRYRESFREGASLAAWLRGIAFRAFLDFRERERRRPRAVPDCEPMVETSGRLAERELVGKLLALLGPLERACIERFHLRGESLAEIATALGLPLPTVKSHLHRGRRKLAARGGRFL